MVSLPSDVRPGHPLRNDDADQLVLAQSHHHHRIHLCQSVRGLGQDYIILALLRAVHVDADSSHGPAGQRLLNLLINHHPVRSIITTHTYTNLTAYSQVNPATVQYSHRNKV